MAFKRTADDAQLDDFKQQQQQQINRQTTSAIETILFGPQLTKWFPGQTNLSFTGDHVVWKTPTQLSMSGISKLVLPWSELRSRLRQLSSVPYLAGHVSFVEWHFVNQQQQQVSADQNVMSIEWISPTVVQNRQRVVPEAFIRLWTSMTEMNKVDLSEFDPMMGGKDQKNMKIDAADNVRLHNICAVLHKLQGESTPADFAIAIDDSIDRPHEAFQLHITGLKTLNSLDLFLLLQTFWVDIADVSIGWNHGVHFLKKAPVVVTVWKSAHLKTATLNSLWCATGIVQTLPALIDQGQQEQQQQQHEAVPLFKRQRTA